MLPRFRCISIVLNDLKLNFPKLELKQLQCKQQQQEMEFINKIFFDKLIKLDNDDDDKKSRESYRKKIEKFISVFKVAIDKRQ
ncbi:hypothetical protein DERF_014364 [Dermatophagoides farinae]|uniref:Uncharacterized protein n=1 Tax=Dermatophagoides farinae TaxID=6954 RepID=A0A922HNY0_DERFA|nr:hypothetical protein DERF_014364 [Dermatophagoides farinae]